ncbi:MAG TPA: hypothetical protein VF771_14725 [Longimicrobiaceae bacterium]
MSKVRFRASVTALAGILIAIGGCSENPSSQRTFEFIQRGRMPLGDVSGTSSAVIDQRGGTVQTPMGDRIVFPAGALTAPTTITLTSNTQYVGVEVEPHGLRFPAGHYPVLVLNSSGANTSAYSSVNVVYIDDSGVLTDQLGTGSGPGTLQAELPHFSILTAVGH